MLSLRTIVMINCGGLVDVVEYFDLPEEVLVFIVDSHRPLNLANLYKNEKVYVFDDGDIIELKEVEEAYGALEFEESDEEKEDEAGEEEEEESEHEEGQDNEDDDGLDNLDDDDDATVNGDGEGDDNEGPSRKRKKVKSPGSPKTKKPKQKRDVGGGGGAGGSGSNQFDFMDERILARRKASESRKRRRERQRLIAEYYAEGNYHGSSVSLMIYTLCSQVGRASSDLLWLGIIGLTDQYIHDRIAHRKYKEDVEAFQKEAATFDLNGGTGRGGGLLEDSILGDSQGADDDDRTTLGDDNDSVIGGGGGGGGAGPSRRGNDGDNAPARLSRYGSAAGLGFHK
ncbi:hypothetical protein HDU76_006125, partial [Blyttiomyces sp. JEL0837]